MMTLATREGRAQTPSDPTLVLAGSDSPLLSLERPKDSPRYVDPPSAPFGTKGQWVLGGGTDVSAYATSFDASSASRTSFTFSPSLDYFFLKNVSVGLGLDLGYNDNKGYGSDSSLVETKQSYVDVGPRFGLNLPLGELVSWWITGTLGVQFISTNESLVSGGSLSIASGGGPSTSQDGLYVSAYAPLLLHPTRHLYLGFGPTFYHQFAAVQGGMNNGNQETQVGAGLVVGGYWGGAAPEAPAQADGPGGPQPPPDRFATQEPSAPPSVHRLGDRGQLLLTNELGAGVSYASFAGSTASTTSGALYVGVDYFPVTSFSLGLSVAGSFTNANSVDASGNTITINDSSFGPVVQLGVVLRIAGPVSLYPRAYLGFAFGGESEKSATAQDTYNTTEVYVTGYVPVVVQLAPHFFAGLGPSASRDLSNTATFPNGQQGSNPATKLGGGAILGGWL